jgi:8-oxo-dGTP pyrophosphatase MutT (NUDIX family)
VRVPTADEVRAALAVHPRLDVPALPGRKNDRETGVLVPLVWSPEPVCVLTVRAAHLRHHAGEVAFPGGVPDASDADLSATALREAAEELGITGARVLGELSSIPLYTSDYRLRPFVAEVPPGELRPNPDEVAAVLLVPVAEMLARPHVDAIPWDVGGVAGMSPVFQLDGHVLYGATAHSFYELLLVLAPLFGAEPQPLRPTGIRWQDVMVKPQR